MSGYSLATSWNVRHHRSWPKVSTLVLATSVSIFPLGLFRLRVYSKAQRMQRSQPLRV